MGSRKEEERNEKIIRGLMKLPPNRRCINCNSLGPQYVCTNFWTFVCMTCSGIHREFTHRVKSVSMAKFTSQEVEALQNGGNQRAREIYLKDWDSQRQRFPDSSNVEKVRQFIRNVYVDRRYAGGMASEKPPRDTQASLGSREDDTRRASSYHSYSQSPPYDYQYEERRYGKQAAVLTRKPGSDRGHYVGKVSSFIYSPGRMSEQMFEDGFANEGSGSRISDYSVSSGGDPFRSGTESPNFSSPRIQPSRDVLSSNASFKRDLDGIPRPQRTTSSGSIVSLESNSMSFKSNNSGGGLVDAVIEPERATGTHHNKVSSFTQSSNTVNYGGLDLFEAQVVPEKPVTSSAPPIDLFQLPAASSAPPVNTLHTTHASSAPPANLHQPPQTSRASSLTLSDIAEQPSTVALGTKSQEVSNTGNEGWATFDTSLPAPSIPETASIDSATMPNGSSSVKFDQYSSFNTSMLWSAFHDSGAHRPAPSSDLGYDNVQAPAIVTNTQSWNAFDDSTSHYPLEGVKQGSESQSAAYKPSSIVDQYLSSVVAEDSNAVGNRIAASHPGPPEGPGPSHVDMDPSYTPTVLSQMEELPAAVTDCKSTNPFDFPYDSDFEQSNMFLDMSSLHAALPNEQLPSTFIGDVGQSWFPQNPVTPYIPAAQGGLAYMAGQAPSSQLSNVSAQGPVASIGGNPFA